MANRPRNVALPTSGMLVERVRKRLVLVSWLRALLLGVGAVALGTLVLTVLATWLLPGQAAIISRAAMVLAVPGFLFATFLSKWKDGSITRSRAALWIEEQVPSLKFALVTLIEIESAPVPTISNEARERLVAAVGAPDVATPLNRSALHQLRVPVLLAALLVAIAAPLQARFSRASSDILPDRFRARRAGIADTKSDAKALANWRVRVIPPAYSALETQNLDDAGQVAALVGSQIEIGGDDSAAPTATVRSTVDSVAPVSLHFLRTDKGWSTRLLMPASSADARFTLGVASRQLLLESRADSIPVVHLALPVRDSVYRDAKGMVTLSASAHDDLGLQTVNFELIVTSGEGERFTARTMVLGTQRLNGARAHHWQAAFLMDSMKLVPGDIIHMRAVARDRHPDAAHELGASVTRTYRVARSGEYDSVAVEPAAPPEVQKSLMSQRMLLIMTEKLAVRTQSVPRETLVSESRKLAGDQVRLRKAIGNLVFSRLEGEDSGEHAHSADDGHEHGVSMEQGKLVLSASGAAAPMTDGAQGDSPIVAINKPLLEAFNAMWDAASALEIAEPKNAISHMKLALAAIERARSAERIYLRGRPPVVIVDVAKVRLVGKDTGQTNTRAAREVLSLKEVARESRLLSAALLLTRDADAGRDSLALLRLESLTDAPRFAAALSDALEVVRRGGDLTAALIRARRAIGGGAKSDSLKSWRGL